MHNVCKTKIVLVGTHQRLNAVESFSVAADNTSLERADTFKYLGVTIEETFSWKEHVSLSGKKVSSRLALLRRKSLNVDSSLYVSLLTYLLMDV